MRALAEAIYAVAYLEWAIIGDLPRLANPPVELSIEGLSRETMGNVASSVRESASLTGTSVEEEAWLPRPLMRSNRLLNLGMA